MSFEPLAEKIVELIGNKENVKSVTHCATRLRFKLKNEEIAKTDEINQLDGVVTVMQSGGQYQVVIGTHVSQVYAFILSQLDLAQEKPQEIEAEANEEAAEHENLFNRFIDIISSVFTPVLGLLAASGMIKGLVAVLLVAGLTTQESGTYQVLWAVGDALFYFFPVALGYTSAKKFGLNPLFGIVIGCALLYPNLANLIGTEAPSVMFQGTVFEAPVYFKFLGIPVLMMSYGQSVIPIIIATFFAAKLEKWLQKVCPDVVKMFFVPFFTLIIVIPLTFIIIGPIATWASSILSSAVLAIYNISPPLAGAVIGGLWQVLVMFGLHWGFIPIGMLNIQSFGYDPVMALMFAVPFATMGAVLGVMLKSKDKKVKSLCAPCFVTGLFGISEPAIYGITLPRKVPFYCTLIAGAVGGLIMGFAGSKVYTQGGLGIFALPNRISESGLDMGFYGSLIGIIAAFIVAFILTFLFWKENKVKTS
ncbi:PTS transporter subunit EIIC [Enterococcus sp. UD-01]|jgi:PTS system beta-glucosides-specific IIC component|uniref:PTS transporter subunit EIIC n=1 Tax=Enterococcus sp. UD-01 TaxID=3373911 RepID=UPI0038381044